MPQFGQPGSQEQLNLNKGFEYFKQSKDAKELLASTEKAIGGKVRPIAVTDKGAAWSAKSEWDAEKKEWQIFINFAHPKYTGPGSVASSILFETLNAASKKQVDAIEEDAYNGRVSLLDYIVQYAFIEYKNTQKHVEYVNKGIKACSWDDSIANPLWVGLTFQYYMFLNLTSKYGDYYLKHYGDAWNANYSFRWDIISGENKYSPAHPVAVVLGPLVVGSLQNYLRPLYGKDVEPPAKGLPPIVPMKPDGANKSECAALNVGPKLERLATIPSAF